VHQAKQGNVDGDTNYLHGTHIVNIKCGWRQQQNALDSIKLHNIPKVTDSRAGISELSLTAKTKLLF